MSSEVTFPLIVGFVGIALLAYFAVRLRRASKRLQAAGRARPRALVVFWVACVVAVIAYAVLLVVTLVGG